MIRLIPACLILLTACGAPPRTAQPITVEYQVEWSGYSVAGVALPGSVGITYTNAQGGTEQVDARKSPWTRTFTARPGQFLYISAQKHDERGTVACVIRVNGQEARRSESTAKYGIATCSGKV